MGCEWSRPQNKRAKCYEVTQQGDQHQQRANGSALPQPDPLKAAAAAQQPGASHAAAAATKNSNLDPTDFMFCGLQSETRLKFPGSIEGQQFIVDNCKDCDLFVLDHCASVTIDDCTNCRIFIGPTEASVFLRDCSNCTLAAITRQLRCRGCADCNLLLLCRTRPIVESSSGMGFGCYDAPYEGLAAQMSAAQLSPFHNFWSDVFDFTPAAAAAEAGSAQQQSNWRLLPDTPSLQELLKKRHVQKAVARQFGIFIDAVEPADASMASESLQLGKDASEGGQQAAYSVSVDAAAGDGAAAPAAAVQAVPAVSVVSEADRMCVIHSRRQQGQKAAGSDGISVCLFALFPAGQHQAALQWVHSSIAQQQQHRWQGEQQQQQKGSHHNSQKEQMVAAEACAAAADPAEVTISCSGTDVPMQELEVADEIGAGAAAVVLYTNEASIPAPVLQQIATAAGWSKQQLKQLGATTAAPAKGKSSSSASLCVGVEAACKDEATRQQLRVAAEAAGALCCTSAAAAHLFRDLGVDG